MTEPFGVRGSMGVSRKSMSGVGYGYGTGYESRAYPEG